MYPRCQACTAKLEASAPDLFIRDLFIGGKFGKDSVTIYSLSVTLGEFEKKSFVAEITFSDVEDHMCISPAF